MPTLLVVTVLLSVLAAAAPAPAATDVCDRAPRAAFTDVADASVHAPGIDCLVWHEITAGVGFDRFDADATLRRDAFAALLDRTLTALGSPLPDADTDRFSDVGGIHAAAIERLAGAGIVRGRGAGRFAPSEPVRRDQLATMLVRAHRHTVGRSDVRGTRRFTDLGRNPHAPMIHRAAALGLLRGETPTRFAPHEHTSRAQAATVLAGLLEVTSTGGSAAGPLATNGYAARHEPIPADLRRLMERTTWRPDCPVPPEDLRLLRVVHTDFAGPDRWGQLVVHHDVVEELAEAFRELHESGFAVARMQPVERFGGDDDASMAANNTSAFNCRRITGGSGWSEHSYGHALDLNPVQNPYVRDGTVLPEAGRDHLDRDAPEPGMLSRPGAVEAFDRIGWGWGGDWSTLKDYQHVSATGR